MKKSLLALAVLGAFAGAASAQSSVTIYGLLDQGVQRTNGGTANNPGTIAGPAGKAYHLRQSSASRLGFRGNEDMGGGLSAQFQIEHRFDPDTGTQTSGGTAVPFWQGRSFVQLSSSTLGSFYAGRDYIPAFWIQLRADPFGNDGVGQSGSTALWANYAAADPSLAGSRTSNTIGYKSPNISGLTVQVAGSASENNGFGRQFGGNVEYLQGPIWIGVGAEARTRASIAALRGHRLVNVGAAYDFGFVRPIAYYARSETGVNGVIDTDVWSVGLTAPVAGGKVKAMYYDIDQDNTTANDRKKFGIGYDYPLSKRTNLYADFGWAKQSRTPAAGGVAAINFSNNKAGAFGIKHTF